MAFIPKLVCPLQGIKAYVPCPRPPQCTRACCTMKKISVALTRLEHHYNKAGQIYRREGGREVGRQVHGRAQGLRKDLMEL